MPESTSSLVACAEPERLQGMDRLLASERMKNKVLFPAECVALLQRPMPSCRAESKTRRKDGAQKETKLAYKNF